MLKGDVPEHTTTKERRPVVALCRTHTLGHAHQSFVVGCQVVTASKHVVAKKGHDVSALIRHDCTYDRVKTIDGRVNGGKDRNRRPRRNRRDAVKFFSPGEPALQNKLSNRMRDTNPVLHESATIRPIILIILNLNGRCHLRIQTPHVRYASVRVHDGVDRRWMCWSVTGGTLIDDHGYKVVHVRFLGLVQTFNIAVHRPQTRSRDGSDLNRDKYVEAPRDAARPLMGRLDFAIGAEETT